MNFALSDEQVLLREAARGSLSRLPTIAAAREALEDPAALPDLWPTAVEAGWPDEGVAAHYGDPFREQRALATFAESVST